MAYQIKDGTVCGFREVKNAEDPRKNRVVVYVTYQNDNIKGYGAMQFSIPEWQLRQFPDLNLGKFSLAIWHYENRYPTLDYLSYEK